MPVRPHLIIHAGTHKTGSTSIQLMLYGARHLAAARGIKVVCDHPAHRSEPTNCSTIAHAFIRSDLWTPTRINGDQPATFGAEEVIEYAVRQIVDQPFTTFVISAEAFCYLRTSRERKHLSRQLSRLDCEVIPLVYLRNREEWHASWLSQIEKMPRTRQFREMHPDTFTLLDDWYFDTGSIVEFWRAISPKAVFLDYDKEVRDRGSVLPSFLEIVGLPQSLGSGDFRNRRAAPP